MISHHKAQYIIYRICYKNRKIVKNFFISILYFEFDFLWVNMWLDRFFLQHNRKNVHNHRQASFVEHGHGGMSSQSEMYLDNTYLVSDQQVMFSIDSNVPLYKDLTVPPYACSYCTYSCKAKQDMVKHNRIHTGEKPFACAECTYKTGNKSNLKRHVVTRHRMNQEFAHLIR